MLFTFKSLYIKCVHKPDFTNAIRRDCPFQLTFFQNYSAKSWKEIRKESNHCHYVKEYDRVRISNYMEMRDEEIDNLLSSDNIYQIAIEEDGAGRAYGILKKDFANDCLFDFLFIDPNHLFHYNQAKSEYPSEGKAKCIMREKTCDEVWTVKWKKPKPKKKK